MSPWSRGVRPNLFLVGVMKAGTTTVYDALRQHPQAFMTPVKEPNYHAWGGTPPTFSGPGDDETMRLTFTRESSYALLFDGYGDESVIGDASTSAFASDRALRRIADMSPDATILVLLREPVDRAYTTYRRLCLVGREVLPTFEEALAAECDRRTAGWEPIWWYAESSRYAGHLERYLREFPEGNVHVRFYDDLQASPLAAVQEVYRCVGLDDTFVPDLTRRYNRSAGLPSTAGPLLDATARRLQEEFAGDVERVAELVGSVPSSWRQRCRS